ncbi:MAG: hypothetical protein PHH26_08235 [Candidatus Thermoplasmatota archaeon]|nr:hypothetical protein [Candidatus Thermoplasmatota archaeon]
MINRPICIGTSLLLIIIGLSGCLQITGSESDAVVVASVVHNTSGESDGIVVSYVQGPESLSWNNAENGIKVMVMDEDGVALNPNQTPAKISPDECVTYIPEHVGNYLVTVLVNGKLVLDKQVVVEHTTAKWSISVTQTSNGANGLRYTVAQAPYDVSYQNMKIVIGSTSYTFSSYTSGTATYTKTGSGSGSNQILAGDIISISTGGKVTIGSEVQFVDLTSNSVINTQTVW